MRWRPVVTALALALLLAACATGRRLEERLQPLVGKREAELVMALGVPTRTYEADGAEIPAIRGPAPHIYPGDFYWGRPYGRFGPGLSSPGRC